MKTLQVRYRGWGEDWLLGRLAHAGDRVVFEYSDGALARGLELSPLKMPLRREAYAEFPAHQHQLPGFIADCLPDGWGLLLMDRHFRRLGLDPESISPLERLAFLGERAQGALTFEPVSTEVPITGVPTLAGLAEDVRSVLSGSGREVLRQLLWLGGSPHGARPKALVYYHPLRGTLSTVPAPEHLPYLFKFPGQGEHPEVAAIEQAYGETAQACGLDMPATCHVDLGRVGAAFGIARFDIEDGLRVPVHTLAGALHVDFRVPSVSYASLLRATRAITRDESEVFKAYGRAVFNVLFNNRDDHPKNIAFRLHRDGRWRLAPAYDLTFSAGPGGYHQMDVGGEAGRITGAHLLELARGEGIRMPDARRLLDRLAGEVEAFEHRLGDRKVRKATVQRILSRVRSNRQGLLASK